MSDSVPAPASKPVLTADAFLRNVRASRLVEPSRMAEVEAALSAWRGADGPMPEACVRALTDRHLLTEWQIGRLRLQADFSGNFFLGRCKLLQPIGKGGMGNVYLAEHTTLGSKVAVKVLPKKLGENKGSSYLERFEREARAAARMNHPNIARAQDLGTSEDAHHFIVMEYIDGTDLEKRVKSDGPLAVRDAADFVRQAALGLQYAHEEGIVHRDIKPANLMVDTRGHLKILDLGLVQVDAPEGSDDTSITQMHDDKVLGTPDYMSPEQALGKRADRRSDIYALGGTFYYLLSGRAPFEKSAVAAAGTSKRQARMRAHLKEPAPNVLDARPDVPIEIAELILRMMEKSPNYRPQSAQEIADALTAWLAVTASAGQRGQPGSARRSAARRPRSDASSTAEHSLRGHRPPSSPGASSSGAPGGGATSDSGSSVRHSGDGSGSHSIGGTPAAGRWSESGIHAPSQSDTPRPSSSGRSTSRMPPAAAVPARAAEAAGADGIFIDVTGGARSAGMVPRMQAAATPAVASPAAMASVGSRSSPGWMFRRIAGLPLAAWLSVAAALVAAMLTAATWWLAGGTEDETDASPDDLPAATETERRSVTPAPKPKPQQPKPEPPATVKPKTRPKPAANKEAGGPSPLDNLLQPDKPAAPEAPAPPPNQDN